MSLLPQQILPEQTPIGSVRADGKVLIDHNWWLFFYNLFLNVLGNGAAGSLPADALIDLASADLDAIDADAIALRAQIAALDTEAPELPDVNASTRDLANALLLAEDGAEPEGSPSAQPAQAIAVGASPFTYQAPFTGMVNVKAGAVTGISLIRQGTSFGLGMTGGNFWLARGDQLEVTYTGAPTMTFFPTGA